MISMLLLIVLLTVFLAGCLYYLGISKISWKQIFLNNRPQNELKLKSIDELQVMLSDNQMLENYERCAEIRDEIKSRNPKKEKAGVQHPPSRTYSEQQI